MCVMYDRICLSNCELGDKNTYTLFKMFEEFFPVQSANKQSKNGSIDKNNKRGAKPGMVNQMAVMLSEIASPVESKSRLMTLKCLLLPKNRIEISGAKAIAYLLKQRECSITEVVNISCVHAL